MPVLLFPKCEPARMMSKRGTGCTRWLMKDDSHTIDLHAPVQFNLYESDYRMCVPCEEVCSQEVHTSDRHSIFLVLKAR